MTEFPYLARRINHPGYNNGRDDRLPFPGVRAKCPDCGGEVIVMRLPVERKPAEPILIDAAGIVAIVPYGPDQDRHWPRRVYTFHSTTCPAKPRAESATLTLKEELKFADTVSVGDQYPNCKLAVEMAYDIKLEREHWSDFVAEFVELDGGYPRDEFDEIPGLFGYRWGSNRTLTRRAWLKRAQDGLLAQQADAEPPAA